MPHINTPQKKKTIGILGGMGPLASANLYHKIVKIAQEEYHAKQDTDFPPMIIYNLPLLGFNETGFADPALVKAQLIAGVKKLENAGSDFIIVACNTVHHFSKAMQDAINIPIISIIEETAAVANKKDFTVVGLLSSESTSNLKIYQNILDTYSIKTLSVTKQQQKLLNSIILHVMSGTQGRADKKCLEAIVHDLCKQGAQGIVLGCTELPLAISQDDINVVLIDSSEVIAKSALRYAY